MSIMDVETEEPADFGNLLRGFRKRARLTQNELAGLSTVSLRTIRNLEGGHATRPRPETVRMLADGLRLTATSRARLSIAVGYGSAAAELMAMQCRLPEPHAGPDGGLIGRERELDLLLELIRAGASRVVSIAGFGGVGKSSLAVALVRRARRSPWLWLDAAGPVTPGEEGLFARWYADFAAGKSEAVEEIARLMGARPSILVLDGVGEHGDGLDAAVQAVLARCPRLTVVETTRRPEPREGRVVVPLGPLPASPSGAPRLLLPLIRAVSPDFAETADNTAHVAGICRSLDGLPRALRAAASWFAFFPPAVVAETARADPAALAGGEAGDWVAAAVGEAVAGLADRSRALLSRLAARAEPWTVEEAALEAGWTAKSVVACLREPLARGLIRPVEDDAGDARRFTVLNLARDPLR